MPPLFIFSWNWRPFFSSLSLLLISLGCHPLKGVTRGGPPPPSPLVVTPLLKYLSTADLRPSLHCSQGSGFRVQSSDRVNRQKLLHCESCYTFLQIDCGAVVLLHLLIRSTTAFCYTAFSRHLVLIALIGGFGRLYAAAATHHFIISDVGNSIARARGSVTRVVQSESSLSLSKEAPTHGHPYLFYLDFCVVLLQCI